MKLLHANKCSSWKAVVIFNGLLLFGADNIFAQSGWPGAWTNIASMPTGVGYASGVAFGGYFYVIDGSSGNWPGPATQVFDPTTDSWSLKSADPVSRAEAVAGVISNKIYAAEGWIQSDANNTTTALEIYDPTIDSWTAGTPSLVARGEAATAVVGGKLYITGGNAAFASGDIATLEIYDPVANSWSTGAPIPVASEGAVGAAISGKFYVAGGYTRQTGGATSNVFIYDPSSNTWSSGSPMPSARSGACGGVINGKLCIAGGDISGGSTNNPVMVYDPAADSWSTAAADPAPQASRAAAVVGGTMLVAGGYPNGAATSSAEAYTPSPQLNIALFGNQSVLFWPADATNYVLQSTTNLAEPNWVTATDAVSVIAVTVINNLPTRSFRLIKQ